MSLEENRINWNALADDDPMWAILTWPEKKKGKWKAKDFFKTGRDCLKKKFSILTFLDIEIEQNRALDFGCGIGRITQAMGKYFSKVDGFDISDKMIALADKFSTYPHCNYQQISTLKNEPSSIYDFILSTVTLQHNEPQIAMEYIIDFIRMLKPGGIAFFDMPSENTGLELEGEAPPKGLEMYSIDISIILSVIKDHGGRIIAILNEKNAWPYWVTYTYIVEKKGKE